MYMGKGGVKAVVLTCSFDLSLGCHAGRDEKGETLLQVCLCTQGTGVKSTKVLRNKGGSRRLWGYVSEHLQAFWKKKIFFLSVLMRFIFSSRPPRSLRSLGGREGVGSLRSQSVIQEDACQ